MTMAQVSVCYLPSWDMLSCRLKGHLGLRHQPCISPHHCTPNPTPTPTQGSSNSYQEAPEESYKRVWDGSSPGVGALDHYSWMDDASGAEGIKYFGRPHAMK